ncbi:MAG: hypothetical protein H0U76_12640 [Ktedonobacteraceae bacterium]|nr:hypothetical protein [Ktedonobacteraceae bacterium]
MSDTEKDRLEVLLESIQSEVRAVHELVADQPTRGEFEALRSDVLDLKREVQAVRLAVTDLTHDLETHKADDRIHFMPSVPHPRAA